MFSKIKWTFWIGLILSILSVLGMFFGWFYFNQTKQVGYVKHYVPAGKLLDKDNIEFQDIRIQNLPRGFLTKEELMSRDWYAADGIAITDPLTKEKITDASKFTLTPDQVIVSYVFPNSGLLTYIKSGDHISILDPMGTLTDVLVLGKYDKDGNMISLIPALQIDLIKDPGYLGQITSGQAPSQPAGPTASLLLLLSHDQANTLIQMVKPTVVLQARPSLVEPTKGVSVNEP